MTWQSWLKIVGVATAAGLGAPEVAGLIPVDGIKPEYVQGAVSAGIGIVALIMKLKAQQKPQPQTPAKV